MKKTTQKVTKFKGTKKLVNPAKEITITLQEHIDCLNGALSEVRTNSFNQGFEEGYVKGKTAGVDLAEKVRKLTWERRIAGFFQACLIITIGVLMGVITWEVLTIIVR